MPRYYFDVHDCDGFHRDDAGDEFESFEDARQQAQALLADIVREELPAGELHAVKSDVRDETGRVVYSSKLTYEGQRH